MILIFIYTTYFTLSRNYLIRFLFGLIILRLLLLIGWILGNRLHKWKIFLNQSMNQYSLFPFCWKMHLLFKFIMMRILFQIYDKFFQSQGHIFTDSIHTLIMKLRGKFKIIKWVGPILRLWLLLFHVLLMWFLNSGKIFPLFLILKPYDIAILIDFINDEISKFELHQSLKG